MKQALVATVSAESVRSVSLHVAKMYYGRTLGAVPGDLSPQYGHHLKSVLRHHGFLTHIVNRYIPSISTSWSPLFRAFAVTAAHSAFVPAVDLPSPPASPTHPPPPDANTPALAGSVASITRTARAAVSAADFPTPAVVASQVSRIAQLTAGEVCARYRHGQDE